MEEEETRCGPRIDSHTFNLMCCGALTRLLDGSFDETLSLFLEESADSDETDSSVHPTWNTNVVRNLKGKMSSGLKKSLSALSGNQRKKSTNTEPTGWFGCPVPEQGPGPIIQLLETLDDSTDVEGLFRVSGSKRRQEDLKAIIEGSQELDIIDVESRFTPHDIASVIKQYLAELPTPLMQQQFLDIYLQISSVRMTQRIEALQLVLLMLPPPNRELLMLLLCTLNSIAENSAVNKMDASNLAIVFAPNLISIPPENNEDMSKFTSIVTDMVKNCTAIFEIHKEVEWQMRLFLGQLEAGESDAPLAVTRTSCQQQSVHDYETEARNCTSRELLQLYEQVQCMPEGKQKQYFMKKFVNGVAETRPYIDEMPQKTTAEAKGNQTTGTPHPVLRCSQREVLDCASATRHLGRWGTPRKRRPTLDMSPCSKSSRDSRDSDRDSLSSTVSGQSSSSPELTSRGGHVNKENVLLPFRQTRV